MDSVFSPDVAANSAVQLWSYACSRYYTGIVCMHTATASEPMKTSQAVQRSEGLPHTSYTLNIYFATWGLLRDHLYTSVFAD